MATPGQPPEQPQQQPKQDQTKPALKTPAEILRLKQKTEAGRGLLERAQAMVQAATPDKANPNTTEYKLIQERLRSGEDIDTIRRKSKVNAATAEIGALDVEKEWREAQAGTYEAEGVIPGGDSTIVQFLDLLDRDQSINTTAPIAQYITRRMNEGATTIQLRAEAQNRIQKEENARTSLDALTAGKEGRLDPISPRYEEYVKWKNAGWATDAGIRQMQAAVDQLYADLERRADYATVLIRLSKIPEEKQAALEAARQISQGIDQSRISSARASLGDIKTRAALPTGSASENLSPGNTENVAEISWRDITKIIKQYPPKELEETMIVRLQGVDRPVVHKRAMPNLHSRYQIQQEIRILNMLRNAGAVHVPQLLGVNPKNEDGEYFFEEYVEGESFDELAAGSTPLPVDGISKVTPQNAEMARACFELLEGMAEIHNVGAQHLNLKNQPDNIIWANVLQSDGTTRKQVKIISYTNASVVGDPGMQTGRVQTHDCGDTFDTILQYGFKLPVFDNRRPIAWLKGIEDQVQDPNLLKICRNLVAARAAGKANQYDNASQMLQDFQPLLARMF